jgi:predicted RNase H-like HicB family nuclease
MDMRKAAKREFNVIVERDEEGYYVASVPALPGCHTQARSLDKLIVRIREAIELCLEVEREVPSTNEFIGVQRVTV